MKLLATALQLMIGVSIYSSILLGANCRQISDQDLRVLCQQNNQIIQLLSGVSDNSDRQDNPILTEGTYKTSGGYYAEVEVNGNRVYTQWRAHGGGYNGTYICEDRFTCRHENNRDYVIKIVRRTKYVLTLSNNVDLIFEKQ